MLISYLVTLPYLNEEIHTIFMLDVLYAHKLSSPLPRHDRFGRYVHSQELLVVHSFLKCRLTENCHYAAKFDLLID